MKLFLALAFLAVASAVPRPGVQPIQLPAPAAPEVATDDVTSFVDAVKIVDVPEESYDPASYFAYAPVDAVNVFDGPVYDVADDQAPLEFAMIDIRPMFVPEEVMRAVREANAIDADNVQIQPVQLLEPSMPEVPETAEAVKIADNSAFAPFDASELTFEPIKVADTPEVYETPVQTVNADAVNELSFEPVEIDANNEVFDAAVDAVSVVDAPVSELSFESVAIDANNEEAYDVAVDAVRVVDGPVNEEVFDTPLDAVHVVDAPVNELAFEPVAIDAKIEETNDAPVDAVKVVDGPVNEEVFDAPVDAVSVVDEPVNELSFEPAAIDAQIEEAYDVPVDTVRVVDGPVNEEAFDTPVDAVKIVDAPLDEETILDFVPEDFRRVPDFQPRFPIRYSNPAMRRLN